MKKFCLIVLTGALCYLAPACDNKRESISVAEVSISPAGPLALLPEQEVQLEAIVMPKNATDKVVTWTTSNPDVATIDSDGLLRTVDGGEALITAAVADGLSTTLVANVAPVDDEWVSKNHATERNTVDWGYPSLALSQARWTSATKALCITTRNGECMIPMLILAIPSTDARTIESAINNVFAYSAQISEHASMTFTPIAINLLRVPGCSEIFENKSIAEIRIALGLDVMSILNGWAYGFMATPSVTGSWTMTNISTLNYADIVSEIKFSAQFKFDNENKCSDIGVVFEGTEMQVTAIYNKLTKDAKNVSTEPRRKTEQKNAPWILVIDIGDIHSTNNPFVGATRQAIVDMDIAKVFTENYIKVQK